MGCKEVAKAEDAESGREKEPLTVKELNRETMLHRLAPMGESWRGAPERGTGSRIRKDALAANSLVEHAKRTLLTS